MNTPRKVNTRPQLIARFEAGEVATTARGTGGAILVYLFETAGAPFFRLVADGGELPEHVRTTYATAAAAIRTAADLCLCMIYDEVAAIEETGDEVEAEARAAALAAGTLDAVGMLEAAEHDDACPEELEDDQGTRETGAAI